MNYYQDRYNGYSINNNCCNHYNDYDYENNFNQNNCDNDKKHSCCFRRTEETFCCYPSYYNEEKKNDKYDCKDVNKDNYIEGSFKICSKCNYNNNNKHIDIHNVNKNECCYEKNDKRKYDRRCHNRCCFCGLFRCW